MDLFDLYAKISLDTGEYEKGLDEAGGKTSNFASKLKTGLTTAAKVGAAAIAAATAATTAMTAALISGVAQTAEYGDNVDKMSQKMGMSAEAYQEWDAIMQHSGTSIESLQAGMKTLANAVESGNDAFERLGISQEQIAQMSNEELFSATITALQNVGNETERTYLAGQLLGRGATELGALLNTSAQDTEAMRQRVHELGGVMSDEAVKASAKFQDNLQDLKTAISGIGRGITSDFLPGLSDLMDGVTRLLTGEDYADEMIASGIGYITDAVNNTIKNVIEISKTIIPAITEAISSFLPMLIELGINLVVQLLAGIASALPELATSAISILEQLVTSIADRLPMLLEAGMETILALANGIAESLPELIPTIVDVVIQIVETLIDNVDMLVDAAIAITLALAEGLIDALPRLIEKAPAIVSKLVTALVENAPKLLTAAWELVKKLAVGIVESLPEIGRAAGRIITTVADGVLDLIERIKEVGANIVSGIFEGIRSKYEWLKEKVSGFFGGIVDSVKDFLGIHSPSKVFAGIGAYMAQGLGKGFADAMDAVGREIDDAIPTPSVDVTAAVRSGGAFDGLAAILNGMQAPGGDLNIRFVVNGREFAVATVPDFRWAQAESPEIVQDF